MVEKKMLGMELEGTLGIGVFFWILSCALLGWPWSYWAIGIGAVIVVGVVIWWGLIRRRKGYGARLLIGLDNY
jgi:putative solute:sodium symporter small subunit